MSGLTQQEQKDVIVNAVNVVLFDGRSKPNAEPLGEDIATHLNANGFEIVKKDREDG